MRPSTILLILCIVGLVYDVPLSGLLLIGVLLLLAFSRK